MTVNRRLRARAIPVAVVLLAPGLLAAPVLGSSAAPSAPDTPLPVLEADDTVKVVEVEVDGTAELDRLVATGVDLDHGVHRDEHGLHVKAVVTDSQVAFLEDLGFELGETLYTEADTRAALRERTATINEARSENRELADDATHPDLSDVRIVRADYYTSFGVGILSVEAKWAEGGTSTAPLVVERDSGPGTELGSGGTQTISRFVDAGVYLYHRGAAPVGVDDAGSPLVPDRVRITSPSGDTAVLKVKEWLPTGEEDPFKGPGYQENYISQYLSPTELYARIRQLAVSFPANAELVELPHQTNGYRRKAQALLGSSEDAAVGVDSVAWGHEGGNDVTIRTVDPATPDSSLSISVTGSDVTVSLATGSDGALVSTAAEVVAALNADAAASALLTAYTFRGSEGEGVVEAAPATPLSDHLDAPATGPNSVPREPQTVYALRIGNGDRDSKPGVLAYAQEHAREWVPPLVTIETAERLLRNYATHAPTRELVDNLDIWIAPSVNPDGGHYSFYDFSSQRKNMTNHCAVGEPNDVAARDAWGVDNNRNYDTYSLRDGYFGASPSCTSGSYAGPGELSEPENRNVDWMASRPNMQFAMNLHSSGNYFMWSPGAYVVPGRTTAPRPSLEDESYFWGASSRILTAIKRHRGLSVTPARTGPIIDVLYSAAGNSGDMLWYKYGIYAWNFEVGTTFQPPFMNEDPHGASAHAESMEYANGLVELMRVARDFDTDDVPPHSSVEVTSSAEEGKVNIEFRTNEAASVFYTLDGTVPGYGSTLYASAGVREGGERIRVPEGTRVNWFSVDAAGNVERGFVPGTDGNYRTWVAEIGWEPPLLRSAVELELDRSSVTVGQAVDATVTVTVDEAGTNPAPTGVVDVLADGRRVGSATLRDDGTARLRLAGPTTAGRVLLTAEYGGDEEVAGGTSAPVPLLVRRATGRVTVVSVKPQPVRTSGPPSRTRARVELRVTAAGVTPRGTVLVRRGRAVLASGEVGARGRVVVRLPRFAQPGPKSLRVVYLGSDSVDRATTGLRVRVVR